MAQLATERRERVLLIPNTRWRSTMLSWIISDCLLSVYSWISIVSSEPLKQFDDICFTKHSTKISKYFRDRSPEIHRTLNPSKPTLWRSKTPKNLFTLLGLQGKPSGPAITPSTLCFNFALSLISVWFNFALNLLHVWFASDLFSKHSKQIQVANNLSKKR